MSLVVKESGNTEFEIIPEGTFIATCVGLYDIGAQYSEKYDKSTDRVIISWELPEETYENGAGEELPRIISNTYTASLGEKANLRRDLEAWRGRAFTEDELAGFDLKNILGKPCMIQVVHKKNGERTYANIKAIMKLHASVPAPEIANEPIYFDMDEEGWEMKLERLPEWVQNKVKESLTYKEKMGLVEEKPFTE
ncbi:MAG: hypothetical protein HFI72_07365 [Peptococcaceae bacterium]|jgi:hypothetical protein|nr:hypothetical protein [Peptococcaceae bacterium]